MRVRCIVACTWAAFASLALAGGPSDEAIRQAATKAIPLLEKGARGHRENRSCFACHNQGVPLLALTAAQSRGLAVDEVELAVQRKFIRDFLAKNQENYLKGKGQGGQIDTAGAALMTLDALGHPRDAVTHAVAEYLLTYQKDQPHYKPSSTRPPSERSPFTSSFLALRGLAAYVTAEHHERRDARTKQVGEWIEAIGKTSETEDVVFRMWGLKTANADPDCVAEAVDEVFALQQEDGGWRQTEKLATDAYATGTALAALRDVDPKHAADPRYRKGLAYLVKAQLDDGSWHVKSRSKPFQTYFESGFPHGKDQFISMAASAWATLALVGALEPAPFRKVEPEAPPVAEVVAKLRALGPNQAVRLGKARIVGEFNATAKQWNLDKTGPMSRDFSIKMVWAPERKRALFCGANHGVPHRLNDVWEFDLAGLTWAMLYAPDNARDYTGLGKDASDVELKDGVFVTKRSGPGIIAHTWWGLTYDSSLREMLLMNTWVTEQKKAAERLGGDPATLYPGPPLWSFSPETRRWTMHRTEKPYPRPIFGGWLETIQELGGTVWHANNWQMQATWLYDAKTKSWRDLKANGDTKAFAAHAAEPEQVGYYDPARKLLVAQRHKTTSHFDVKTLTWKKVLDRPKDADDVPYGHDAYAPMVHDPASGRGLLMELKTGVLWSYDPDAVRWERLTPTGDALPPGNRRLAYFDPAHGVFVVIQGAEVWAYRPGR